MNSGRHSLSRAADWSILASGRPALRQRQDGSFDLGVNVGQNRVKFDVPDSINASLGVASARSFYAGGMKNTQTNLSLDYVCNAADLQEALKSLEKQAHVVQVGLARSA